MEQKGFSGLHPLVGFFYFALVLVFTMFFDHPVSLGLSLGAAVWCAGHLNGWRSLASQGRYLLPTALFAALLNPAFNHRGDTVLARFPTGSALTLESVLYGLAAAAMLCAVLLWFSCYHTVMTSDKFLYLFGRIIPALSLVLSMALRFVPRFKAQLRAAVEAQRSLGRDISQGGLLRRLRLAGAILSILVTWSLENAIDTADSMKSRGYGLPGRTAFSLYRLDGRDLAVLGWLALSGGAVLLCWALGGLSFQYYPTLQGDGATPLAVGGQLAYLALCLTPVILNRWEAWKWTRSQYAL